MQGANEVRSEILQSQAVRGIVYSRGDGAVEGVYGAPGVDERKLAGWLDVGVGALSAKTWSDGSSDKPDVTILLYPQTTMLVGALSANRRVAVVAGEEASVGLLLVHLRKLIAEEST